MGRLIFICSIGLCCKILLLSFYMLRQGGISAVSLVSIALVVVLITLLVGFLLVIGLQGSILSAVVILAAIRVSMGVVGMLLILILRDLWIVAVLAVL